MDLFFNYFFVIFYKNKNMIKKITFDMDEMEEILEIIAPEKKENTPEEYLLVTVDADYADEFDVCHAYVMTREGYNECVKVSKENIGSGGGDVCFGTNEEIRFEDFSDYMSNISVKVISKEDYEAFNRMFGADFGMIDNYFPYGC